MQWILYSRLMLLDVLDKAKLENSQERRREHRIVVDEEALVSIVNKDRPAPRQVRVLDISRNGMKLLSRQELQLGTLLHIRFSNAMVFAKVRRCDAESDSFHVGVQIVAHYTIPAQ